MEKWKYEPSPAIQQKISEQLTVFPREKDLTHAFLRFSWSFFLRIILRIYFRLKIINRHHLPRKSSFVLVANHSSHLDAMILSTLIPLRQVNRAFIVAAKDYFFSSLRQSFLAGILMNSIPFDRKLAKKESLELCADVLDAGTNALLMFPEGTRSPNGKIQPFKKGIGILVAGTKKYVVPCYIHGVYRAWPKGRNFPKPYRVQVLLGKPLGFEQVPPTEEGFLWVARQTEESVKMLREKMIENHVPFLKRLKILVMKLFVRSIGRSSTAIRMCCDYGLTAGKTVDYIYRQVPSGSNWLGQKIDKWFLNHPGWEAVRIRREHLEILLENAVKKIRQNGQKPSILDVASGPALYIQSVMQKTGEQDMTVLCQDLDSRWLEDGRIEAGQRGLKNIRFKKGDAFDSKSLLDIRPQPNIAVSSGFYDWITQDEDVKKSMIILFEVLENNGYLIVTNQVDHPDLQMVSRVFTGFNQEPLRMKMRSSLSINQWLEEAGFNVLETLTDKYGYYSVTLAEKK